VNDPSKIARKAEKIMATSPEKDLSDHLERIRADISSLSETVATLVSDTAGIKSTLKRGATNAAKQAAAFGEDVIHEATEMGNDAMHAAARGANAAVQSVESQIERNPLTSVLIALGFGFAIGILTRK
jgi:ElaB/YqjD/DUF883 family membrane-anchored ribosome-binding protein